MTRRQTEIERSVRSFLGQSAPAHATAIEQMPADASLWDVVGSLNLLELVDYVEKQFDIRVHPLEFIPENFSSIARIVAFTVARIR